MGKWDVSVSGSQKLPLTDCEATAFMSKQRSGLRMSALLEAGVLLTEIENTEKNRRVKTCGN